MQHHLTAEYLIIHSPPTAGSVRSTDVVCIPSSRHENDRQAAVLPPPGGWRLSKGSGSGSENRTSPQWQREGAMDEQDRDTSVAVADLNNRAARARTFYANNVESDTLLLCKTGMHKRLFRLSPPSCFDFLCPSLALPC